MKWKNKEHVAGTTLYLQEFIKGEEKGSKISKQLIVFSTLVKKLTTFLGNYSSACMINR